MGVHLTSIAAVPDWSPSRGCAVQSVTHSSSVWYLYMNSWISALGGMSLSIPFVFCARTYTKTRVLSQCQGCKVM